MELMTVAPLPKNAPLKAADAPPAGEILSVPVLTVMSPPKYETALKVSEPVLFLMIPPGFAPFALITPPPSIAPLMVTLPAPAMVVSLMIVCSGPLTVRVLPPAMVHVCGPPM